MDFLLSFNCWQLKKSQKIHVVVSKSKCIFTMKSPASKAVSLLSEDLCNDLSCLKPSNEKLLTQAAEVCKTEKGKNLCFS